MLFCYDEFDELTMLQLREWDRKLMRSVETEMVQGEEPKSESETGMFNITLTSASRMLVPFFRVELRAHHASTGRVEWDRKLMRSVETEMVQGSNLL